MKLTLVNGLEIKKNFRDKWPRNNPIKPFQFCLCVVRLVLAFLLLVFIVQKSAIIATLR